MFATFGFGPPSSSYNGSFFFALPVVYHLISCSEALEVLLIITNLLRNLRLKESEALQREKCRLCKTT
jgi:hypothetical protein